MRINRSWFSGASGAAVDIGGVATPGPATSAAHVGVHLSQLTAALPSVLALRSADTRAVVHGLWLDLCSRLESAAASGLASFVDESGATTSSAGIARLSASFDAAPPQSLFSNGGNGFEVDGHHATLSTGRRQDPLRAGGNLLVDTRMAILGKRWSVFAAPGVTVDAVTAVDGSPGDPVLGKIDLVRIVRVAGQNLIAQAVTTDVPGEPAVMSVYARLGSDLGAAWVRLRVLAGNTWITDTVVALPVQPYWQRFSCRTPALPSIDTVCVVVIDTWASESAPAETRPTVLFWAPQFEIGTEPTAYQPREDSDSVAQTAFPRQVQAMMLGPTVFGYSPTQPATAPASARRGDRVLSTHPTGGVDGTEAWIATGSGPGGVAPLSPMASGSVEQCGAADTKSAASLLSFVLQHVAGSAKVKTGAGAPS